MGHKFSKTSRERLETCHPDIQAIMFTSLYSSMVDFGIACGHRSIGEQQKLYAQGRTAPGPIVTYVDGIKKKSKHNYRPSEAVDIYAFVNGRANWSERYFCYLAGVINAVAIELYDHCDTNHLIRWGGNFDSDGEIITDQSFIDLPHFELVKPK